MNDDLALRLAQFRDRAEHCRELAQSTTSHHAQVDLIALARSYEYDAVCLCHGASATTPISTSFHAK